MTIKNHLIDNSRTIIILSLVLTFVGFSISLISSIGVEIFWISLENQFGILQVLPWQYWLGFTLCLISIIAGIFFDSEVVFLTKVILFFILIWGIPSFFESNASIWDTYTHYSGAIEIANQGIPSYDVNLYNANWPGSFIFLAIVNMVPHVNPLSLIKWYPLITASLTLVALHLFLRMYLSGYWVKLSLVMTVLLNVWFQFHISPQSLGLLAGFLIFICLEKRLLSWKIVAIILFTFVLISHATTMFIVVTAVAVAYILKRVAFKSNKSAEDKKDVWSPALLFIVLAITWLFWNAVGSSQTLVKALESQAMQIFFLENKVGDIVGVRTATNLFPIPPRIRLIALGIFGMVFLSYLIYPIFRWFFKKSQFDSIHKRGKKTLPFSLVLVSIFLTIMDILTFGGQFYDRNILFFAVVAPIFAVSLTVLMYPLKSTITDKNKKRNRGLKKFTIVTVTMLLVTSFASFTTIFYQENFYLVSDASFSARDFTYHNFPTFTRIEGGMFAASIEPNSIARPGNTSGFQIVILDIHTEIWMKQWLGMETYQNFTESSVEMCKIYDNGEYQMFWESIG